MERGDKLNQLEEKAEKMRNEAENFSQSAHELMLKYKDKKWYQLWSHFLPNSVGICTVFVLEM